jgi:3-methylcrotonyl-CoA carboxylase beta subunit
MREIIARLVDGSRFHEYQPAYGTTLVCGFARLWATGSDPRQQRRALQRQLAQGRALHGARESEPHASRVFAEHHRLHGRPGYEARGITKDGAKMIMAVTGSVVPKFTVIDQRLVRRGQLRNVRACLRRRLLLFMWPQGQISVMGGEQAAGVLSEIKIKQPEREGRKLSAAEVAAIREPILEEYTPQLERVLQHVGALGRRPARSAGHAQRARNRHLVRAERADRRAELRGLSVLGASGLCGSRRY